ncbi:hypothetical protein RRG08_043820 [Elysia crispata]|uniref:Translation initiation factor beta propellor-like domain-containing protein n=1 Tax=Elysia crispata TaxID=231223 RepID=A0AAE1B7X4_9GAST|nr:hypothetical protein RRG08_043820 [Elysia crispata]
MTSLATLGEEGKIWEVPTFKVLEQFNPYEGPMTDLTWSHDGHSIACCCSTDTSVHLRNTKDVLSSPSRSFQLPAECLSLDFNSDSRFLLCGCVDGTLHIYDRKFKSISKSYRNQSSAVCAVRWNWNNKCIAAGTKNGEIILYNIVTSQASSPLVGRSTQAIQQLKYNPYKKAMLVATSDDGAVNLWDTNTRRLIRNFDQTHHASAKDVAFSPINDIFMVSVGLDKRAIFYNLESKTSIQTIVADHPLTCVDVLHDGTTVAVGTMHGQVFLYDMRKSSSPVFSFPAHRSSVKRLSFVRKESRKGDSTAYSSSHSTSDSLRRQLPMSPGHPDLYNGSSVYSPRDRFSKSDIDIISPLARGNKSNNSIPDIQWTEKSGEGAKIDLFVTSDSAGGTAHDLFSPVKANLSQSMDSTGGGRMSSAMGNFSFLAKVLGSNENSLNRERSHHSLHRRTAEENGDILRSTPSQQRSHHSLHRTTAEENAALSESVRGGSSATSPPRTAASERHQNQHKQHAVTFDERPSHILDNPDRNGSASSPRSQHSPHSRLQESAVKQMSPRISGSKSMSPPRSLQSLESPRAGDPAPSFLPQADVDLLTPSHRSVPLSGAEAAASTLNSSVTSSLRSFIQDLLHEQLQVHQASLQAEIRAMMSGSGPKQGQTSTPGSKSTPGVAGSHNTHHYSETNPEVYQAEFIRSLVKDELCNIQDWMSEWFWAIKRDQIKTSMMLERMEALLADSCINPVLLEEIEALREENARLRKTF